MNDWILLNWTLMALSIGVLPYLGIRSMRIANTQDESGFLIAGRSLGPFVGAASIMATGYSGWGFVGSPGVAYQYGAIEVLGNFLFAPAFVLAILFFARALRRFDGDLRHRQSRDVRHPASRCPGRILTRHWPQPGPIACSGSPMPAGGPRVVRRSAFLVSRPCTAGCYSTSR